MESRKTFFSDKSSSFEKISLIKKDRVITDDSEIAETFNQHFSNIVSDLALKVPDALTHHSPKVKDPILSAISKYQNHSSIRIILQNCKNHFFFKTATLDDEENEPKK